MQMLVFEVHDCIGCLVNAHDTIMEARGTLSDTRWCLNYSADATHLADTG